jgi:hypothetical protein
VDYLVCTQFLVKLEATNGRSGLHRSLLILYGIPHIGKTDTRTRLIMGIVVYNLLCCDPLIEFAL